MNRNLAICLLVVLAFAVWLRLPRLDQRPLHADESVHAYKFLDLWRGQGYRYDPHEYHGPSLYYATLPFAWLSRANDAASLQESTLRLVPVAFGLGLILLLPLLADGLGRAAVAGAAWFTAISPAFVYYSRYYIHEMLLVFFTLLFLAAGWRYARSGRAGWALLAGAALGLMHATKETFVFNLAAMLAGFVMTLAWGHWREGALWWPERPWNRWHVAGAGIVAAVVSTVLFTSGFTHARGVLDSLLTYGPWFGRAGGASPHTHSWTFYFVRLFWFRGAGGPVFTELLIGILALVGFVAALRHTPARGVDLRPARFLGFYTLALAFLYTVVPYKTPWCALNFHHGLILLAGVGAVLVLRLPRRRWVVAGLMGLMLAGSVHLVWQAHLAAFRFGADRRNPWVYAHTSTDLLRLVAKVREIAATAADPAGTVIKVMGRGGDYWPLPWYLRGFKRVGFFPNIPDDPWAPLMIVTSKFDAELDEKSGKKWLMTGLYEQRPNVFFELYVELDLWKRYLASRPPPDDRD